LTRHLDREARCTICILKMQGRGGGRPEMRTKKDTFSKKPERRRM
jgi:ribosomal protein L34E